MKIQTRCRSCDRGFPLDVVLAASPGRCPMCGVPFDQHYAGSLVPALENLQRAGAAFEEALRQVAELGHNLEVDGESVLGPLRSALAAHPAGASREGLDTA